MLKSIATIFRVSDWWGYIFPPVLGVIYAFQYMSQTKPNEFFEILLAFFISVIGSASFGFLINDISDIESDKLSQKRNYSAQLSKIWQAVLVIVSLNVAILPWLHIPFSLPAIVLFSLQLILLSAYSLPPVRLKNHISISVLVDALYSSVLPIAIAFFVFKPESMQILFIAAYLALLAAFVLRGFRNILLHQVLDSDNDQKSGLPSFVLRHGSEKTIRIVSYRLLPVELGFSFVFIGIISIHNIWFALLAPVYILYIATKSYNLHILGKSLTPIQRLQLHNDFYEDVLPLVFLVLLSLANQLYIYLAVVHIVLFRNKIVFFLLGIIIRLLWHRGLLWLYYHPVKWIYYKGFRNKYVKKYFTNHKQ